MGLLQDCHIAYVNLDKRGDRRAKMIKSLQKAQIFPYERVPGILPQPYRDDPKYQVMWNRTPGAIGCHLSQRSVIEKASKLSKHALVMEDDLEFCDDFQERIQYIERWMNSGNEWDIVWLGATFHVGPSYWHKKDIGKDAETTDDPRMIRTFGCFCTYAYIINSNSTKKVLSLLDKWVDKSIGIDWIMIQIQPELKTFSFVPGCIKQYDNLSDQVPGKPATTYFSKFAKLNGTIENSAYWWQNKMEDFDPTTFDWKEAKRQTE